jgi:YARHG domain
MSRRTVVLLAVFLGGLLAANVVVLALWLPHRKGAANQPSLTSASAPAPASTTAPAPMGASPASIGQAQPNNANPPGGFTLEREVASPSGALKIQYLRDRKTKMRRVAVQDAHQPGVSTTLCESKRSAWALVSPDDQWIVLNERGGTVRLFRRSNNSTGQFAAAEDPGTGNLQDTIWQAYLAATQTDPATPRRGITIDPSGWDDSSHKVNFSVVYLAGQNNPEVPAPWSCTYDVTSKRVEPMALADNGEDNNERGGAETQPSSEPVASHNSFEDSNSDPTPAEGEANELQGERFPATRLDELQAADVNESSLNDMNYAVNEMYARHGVDFKDKKTAAQFSGFSWYKVRPGLTFADAEGEFSDLEKQNLKVLRQCREAKSASAHHKTSNRPQHHEEESTGSKVLRGLRMWQESGAPMPPHP